MITDIAPPRTWAERHTLAFVVLTWWLWARRAVKGTKDWR